MLKELPFRLFWVENTETLLFCFFFRKNFLHADFLSEQLFSVS